MRRLLAVCAVAAASWALLVLLTGGFVVSVGGVPISSTGPIRPLVVAVVTFAAYVLVTARTRRRTDLSALTRHLRPRGLALLLVLGTIVTALTHNSWTAGGADEYSYVS